jgi:hypothetical protein
MQEGDPNLPNRIRILFYSPWSKASKKVKRYDCRVNLFYLPDAYHNLVGRLGKENFNQSLNYVPTLVTIKSQKSGDEDSEENKLLIEVNDNPTAIQHELGS